MINILLKGSFILLLIVLIGCEKPEELSFFEVTLEKNPIAEALGVLVLEGNIEMSQASDKIDNQGFIWSSELEHVQSDVGLANKTIATDYNEDTGRFTATLSDLSVEPVYYFRAFAERNDPDVGKRVVYSSNIESFSFQLNLSIVPIYNRINDQLIVNGTVTGLNSSIFNLKISELGFIYSSDDTNPILSGGAETTFLPEMETDGPVVDTLDNLSFNTKN